MNLKKYTSLFIVVIAAIVGLIVHKIASHFVIPKEYEDNFVYSIPMLYVLFGMFSLVIVSLLTKVKEVAINYICL